MKQQHIILLLVLFLSLGCDDVLGFQFMKNWKIPTRDRQQEAVEEKFGDKKLVVISDASSDYGRKTTQALLNTGEYHVIGGARNLDEMKTVAKEDGFAKDDNFTPMLCDMDSFNSVRDFCNNVEDFRLSKPLDRLVCLADASCSKLEEAAKWSKDGHEQTMQVNYLSPFLMTAMLLEGMEDSPDARLTFVSEKSSKTNNTKVADLADLKGFQAGFSKPIAMGDGSTEFSVSKAYEDSKLCQRLLTNFLHTKYHRLTQITFNNIELDAEYKKSLFDVVHDPKYSGKSGLFLTQKGDSITESVDPQSSKGYDIDTAYRLFKYSEQLTGAQPPQIKQVTSPCPTLKVIGAVTKGQVRKQELKRMREMGRPGISEPVKVKLTKRQKVAAVADKVVGGIFRQTVGRAARVVSKKLLGDFPEEALSGSFHDVSDDDVKELEQVISEQLYKDNSKDRFGDKKLVVITGTSSGLGRKTAMALLRTGEYHVIGGVRDLDKMEAVAEIDGFDMDNFTPMLCEMNSFDSVRAFCKNVNKFRQSKPVDRLICNAGVYQPSLRYPKWSKDGHEQTMQINFLSHFLIISLLMDSMRDSPDPRVTMVGSVTGNDNTVGGGGVYPIADLHDLDGLKAGFKNPIAMADGYGFIGAKAYKDSKLCLMVLANFLHAKYHRSTGIAFSSMYPGCIAETPLFREKRSWFRKYFPIFMKFITGGYVGDYEAGQRLFQVAHDPRCAKSGVYWSWNGGPREGRGAAAIEKGGQISGGSGAGGGWDSLFENDQSSKALSVETGFKLFQYATAITGAEWPGSFPSKMIEDDKIELFSDNQERVVNVELDGKIQNESGVSSVSS